MEMDELVWEWTWVEEKKMLQDWTLEHYVVGGEPRKSDVLKVE